MSSCITIVTANRIFIQERTCSTCRALNKAAQLDVLYTCALFWNNHQTYQAFHLSPRNLTCCPEQGIAVWVLLYLYSLFVYVFILLQWRLQLAKSHLGNCTSTSWNRTPVHTISLPMKCSSLMISVIFWTADTIHLFWSWGLVRLIALQEDPKCTPRGAEALLLLDYIHRKFNSKEVSLHSKRGNNLVM